MQLHIGESFDSGFDAAHRPGMTKGDQTKKSLPSFLTAGLFSACSKFCGRNGRNAYRS
jgi:hypothetical protein